jgi:signal transduction histidine kinase
MRRYLAEAAIVIATAGVSVVGTLAEYHEQYQDKPLAGALVLTAVTVALMPLRHRAAVRTGIAILAACLVYRLLGYHGLALAAPLYAVCHTIVATGRSRRSLWVGAAVALGVPVISLLPPPPPPGINMAAVGGVSTLLVATLAMAEARRIFVLANEEKVQRVTQESDRRVVAERLTIARELHDLLAHTVTVISVQAAAGLDALPTRPEQTADALRTIRGAAKDAMAELRSTLRVLRDDPATEPAPQPRLDQVPQLVESARGAGLVVEYSTTGAVLDIPVGTELAAYRIIQEALTNVIRHAHATTATVRVDYQSDTLLVAITDNGTAVANGDGTGHGMIGMRERVRAVGGTFEAGPAPDGGFAVTARLSLEGAR